ncbi:MAG: relaxase, partial [Marivirga sp.]|nr:relaxase [Marivirga sp.]
MRTGQNILGALNYNENKVKAGDAECIAANMFGCEPDELSFNSKKNRFQEQMRLNKRSKTNVVHISLNFAVSEKLTNEKLQGIANAYMDRIGFTNQPYLVYNHFDAGHPHIHILTTSIQDNGKRIPLHNLGKNQSEKARKEIETIFNLVKAEGREINKEFLIDPKTLAHAIYGKSQTKEAISKIVRTITRSYKFTSIPELNAVLQQYNVVADRGRE